MASAKKTIFDKPEYNKKYSYKNELDKFIDHRTANLNISVKDLKENNSHYNRNSIEYAERLFSFLFHNYFKLLFIQCSLFIRVRGTLCKGSKKKRKHIA